MKTILRLFFACVFGFITFSSYCQVLTDPRLIAYYGFEGNAKDNSSYANNGTIFGNPQTVSGVNGCALFFDGVDDYISVPSSQSLNSISNEFTISGWAFPMSLYNGDYITLLTKGIVSESLTPFSIIYRTNSLYPYLRFTGLNGIRLTIDLPNFPNSLVFKEWNFIVWRFKNGLLEIFRNGSSVGQYNFNFNQVNKNNEPLEFARDAPGVTEFYHGIFDEFCIFNRALSDAEILTAYRNFKTPQAPTTTLFANICQGEAFEGYTVSGLYRDTFASKGGCDSVRLINLTVSSSKFFSESITICAGESYQGYSVVGTYQDTFITATGCDSIRILRLALNPTIETNIAQSVCTGESFENYTLSGIYRDTFRAITGCDSVRILDLSVRQVLVPNAFTPNGDGHNDYFELISENTDVVVKRYLIFNRWGEVVYEAKDFIIGSPNTWWDGEQKSKSAVSDVYVYIIEYECAERSVILKGDVTLIR